MSRARPTTVGMLRRGMAYTVRDLGGSQEGYTDLIKRELGVSRDAEGAATRYTQLHELSHVRHSLWSPARIRARVQTKLGADLPVTTILAAEDARINELLLRSVPDAHVGYASRGPYREDIAGYVASHAAPPACRDAIAAAVWGPGGADPALRAALDAAVAKIAAAPSSELTVWRATVPLALAVARAMRGESSAGEGKPDTPDTPATPGAPDAPDTPDTPGKPPDDAEGTEGAGEPESDGAGSEPEPGDVGEAAGTSEDLAPDTVEDATELGAPNAHGRPSCGSPHEPAPTRVPWVIPEVLEPALTVPRRGGNATVRSGETGASLRWSSLHRIQTDGQVFRRVARRPGAVQRGTVLVDVSGSMSLSVADVDAIIDVLPHATVAVYAGSGVGKAWIVVVAREGRRVASLQELTVMAAGGNMCDGPALLWLSRQQRPLLWICDGGVTGEGDSYSSTLVREADAIMQAAHIVQVCGTGAHARLAHGSARLAAGVLARVVLDVEHRRVG